MASLGWTILKWHRSQWLSASRPRASLPAALSRLNKCHNSHQPHAEIERMTTLFEREPEMKTTALAPWFGSARMIAPLIAKELRGCKWVGVPFAGGMSELAHIKASTIVVSDLHRHVINLARVVAERRELLQSQLVALTFHPDELRDAQE